MFYERQVFQFYKVRKSNNRKNKREKKVYQRKIIIEKDIFQELDMSRSLNRFISTSKGNMQPAATNKKLDTERGLIGVDKPSC